MLTIRAMAVMGPWMLVQIDRLEDRVECCERCGTKIKWVWVMEKQNEPREVCRIGNECGPKLEDISQELWDSVVGPFETSMNHVRALDRLAGYERVFPECRPTGYDLGWAAGQLARLAEGITPHERRVMGSQISQFEKAYKRRIRAMHGTRSAQPAP